MPNKMIDIIARTLIFWLCVAMMMYGLYENFFSATLGAVATAAVTFTALWRRADKASGILHD